MQSKLKILEATEAFFPNIDGVVNVVKNYAEQLNKTDECTVCAPKPAKKSKYKDEEAYEVLRCNSFSAPENYRAPMPSTDLKFKKKLYEKNFDLIHVHSPFMLGRYCLKMAKKRKIPTVLTLHTKYKVDFQRTLHGCKPLINFMMRYIMKTINGADNVWTVSNTAVQELRDYGYKGEVRVVKSGTDFKYPDNAEELIAKIDEAHGLKGQEHVFLFVGRIAMYKNLGLLTDALKIVKEKGVDFKMIMVGGGFDVKKMKEKVEEAGLSDRFIFTGTVKDRKILQGYYLRSDLFLFPSTFDTCSLVSIEAAAHKLPVVVIKDSCPAEGIEDGVNGFISDEDSEIYAEKIISAINDKNLTQIGENAYKTVYRTWEQVAEELREKYVEIIEEYKNGKKQNV